MKKIIVSLLLLVCVSFSFAQSYNSAQELLRKEIKEYLSRKGFSPENQSDGLKFKSEGANYYVEIDVEMKKPMYIRLRRYIKYDEKLSLKDTIEKLSSLNSKKGVKVCCQEQYVVLSFEMFLTKSSEFTYVFEDALAQVKRACSQVKD